MIISNHATICIIPQDLRETIQDHDSKIEIKFTEQSRPNEIEMYNFIFIRNDVILIRDRKTVIISSPLKEKRNSIVSRTYARPVRCILSVRIELLRIRIVYNLAVYTTFRCTGHQIVDLR